MLESSRELRIGVVGIGARCYLAAFADSSPVPARLVAAADTAPDAAERAERLLPEGVAVVGDHRDLLECGLDAVVLTTPDDTHEELAAIRPDLDGGQIMAELGVAPGPIVGEAYRFLMDLRMEKGPIGEDLARQALRSWWAARQKS